MTVNVEQMLGADAEYLLGYNTPKVSKDLLHLPGPDFIDRVMAITDRPPAVLRNLQLMFNTGRLGGTGAGMGTAQTLTVHGRLLASQNTGPIDFGTYADSITATITY